MSNGGKISTDGGQGLGHNPFGGLSGAGRPSQPAPLKNDTPKPVAVPGATPAKGLQKSRGRVDIRRETGGRGGKTVTVVDGFMGIGLPEKERLTKQMRAACGCGGTVKDGAIVIQGDQRETVAQILQDAGFRTVWAGG